MAARRCLTCDFWGTDIGGLCENFRSRFVGKVRSETQGCYRHETADQVDARVRRRSRVRMCSICSDRVTATPWNEGDLKERPWLRAKLRIPLCQGCGHVIWGGETAWHKRVGADDTPREMLGLLRKVKECAGFLRRAANGGLQYWPYQGEK